MIRGLWTSAGGMDPAVRAQEVLANNLANASTSGFRQDRIAFHRAFAAATNGTGVAPQGAASQPAGQASAGAPSTTSPDAAFDPARNRAPLCEAGIDQGSGALETTGSRFHLALSGPGFFVVQGPEGELYTRDGTLQRSADGTLLHRSGYPLLTEGGAITVPPSGDFTVAADGTVFVNGAPQGKLRIAALPDAGAARHAGQGLLSCTQPGETDTTSRVLQGSLEAANVDPVLTMVEMVSILRGYEANQKAILAQDGSLGRLIQWAAG